MESGGGGRDEAYALLVKHSGKVGGGPLRGGGGRGEGGAERRLLLSPSRILSPPLESNATDWRVKRLRVGVVAPDKCLFESELNQTAACRFDSEDSINLSAG